MPLYGLPAFGQEFGESSDDGTSSTTSDEWQTKLSHDTDVLTSGHKYRIGWSMEVKHSNFSGSITFRVRIGGTVVARGQIKPWDGSNWYFQSGFLYDDALSGVVAIDIRFRNAEDSGTASVRRARLEIWRVG